MSDQTANALFSLLTSDNMLNHHMDAANIADVIHEVSRQAGCIANAITAPAVGGQGVNGGGVESLTEAVMDASESINNIASAIHELADAVRSTAKHSSNYLKGPEHGNC